MDTSRIESFLHKLSLKFFVLLILLSVIFYFLRSLYEHPLSISAFLLYLVIIGSAGCIFLRNNTRISAMLVVISAYGSLFAANLLFYYFIDARHSAALMSKYEITKVAKEMGIPFDERSRLDVVNDLQGKGVDAVPFMCPKAVADQVQNSVLPLSGVPDRVTVLCNETGEYSIYRSDRYGFNNPDSIYEGKDMDVVLLGDSFTHGSCVPQEQNIAGSIRAIKGLNVANLGCGGNGPMSALAAWEEYGKHLKPRYVVWNYFEGNDIGDIEWEQESLLKNYLTEGFSQNLKDKTAELTEFQIRFIDEQKKKAGKVRVETKTPWDFKSELFRLLTVASLRLAAGLTREDVNATMLDSDPDKKYDEYKNKLMEVVKTANTRVVKEGGRFVFVYIPSFITVTYGGRRFLMKKGLEHYKEDILAELNDLGILVLDMEEIILRHPDPVGLYPFRVRGHFTPEGYKLVANSIIAKLRD